MYIYINSYQEDKLLISSKTFDISKAITCSKSALKRLS